MHRQGHIGIGLLLYSPLSVFLFEIEAHLAWALGLSAICFWSVAPDIDVALPLRHRGPTHTVWAALSAGMITSVLAAFFVWCDVLAASSVWGYLWTLVWGFFIGSVGVLGHLLGDAITPMRIQPLYPYSDRTYGVKLVLSKNKSANQALGLIGTLALTGSLVLSTLYV